MATKPCGRPTIGGGCTYPRMYGKQQCVWHWLLKQDAATNEKYADQRYAPALGRERVSRVPKELWPDGERWCSGCQSFVPLFYTSGSRCKACASRASHRAMVEKTYGIPQEDYDRLLRWQRGRCYICGRKSPSRRLAVDHDHETGAVRGLLCPDPDRGCNHKVLGIIEAASVDGGLAAARRLVEYLERSPYERMQAGEQPSRFGGVALRDGGCTEPPPF